MNIKKIVPKPIFFLLILLLILPGCDSYGSEHQSDVSEIKTPLDLPSDLHDLRIVLQKTGSNGTIFVIKSIDQLDDRTYHLEKQINDLVISPDGNFAVYTNREYLEELQPKYLWKLDLHTSIEKKIAGWDVDYSNIYLGNPSYSIDGKQIIFSITWFDTGKTGLGKVNSDGSDLRILNTDLPMAVGPKLSHNGLRILVTCVGEEKDTGLMRFQLCILDDDGKHIKTITNSGDAHGSYFFSPEDEYIVYNELERGGLLGVFKQRKDFLYITYPDYENRQMLLDWIVGIQAFSNDGQQIIFEGRPNEKTPWGIYIINIDGTNLRHLIYFDEFLEEWYADVDNY